MESDLFPERIETDRLVLEPLTRERVDVLEYYEICSSDPDIETITRYVTWDPHETAHETFAFLRSVEERIEDGEGVEYVVRPAEGEPGAGEIAGASGLGVDWDRRVATFGIWLRKRFWGRGYSGERAAAFMAVAFDRLDLEYVEVDHLEGNERSRRAIEKYVDAHGGQRDGVVRNRAEIDGELRDAYRYTVSREQYESAAGTEIDVTLRG